MKLMPLGDRVVLKKIVAEETTKSGLIIAGAEKEKPQMAEVVAVGPGTEDVKMQVSVGDQVVYAKYACTDVTVDDEDYMIIKQDDILAILK